MKGCPPCAHCGEIAEKVTGAVIYPHRSDLFDRVFYQCKPCGAYVGSHKATGEPLGYPANAELRKARSHAHAAMDPIWQDAWQLYEARPSEKERAKFRRIARNRLYAYLADLLEIDRTDMHTAMLTIEQCRVVWKAVQRLTYREVRDWWKANGREKAA